jgi:small GTP-binding protein
MQLTEPGFKVSFVGDANVGKTSVIASYSTHTFLESPAPTVGTSVVQVKLPPGSVDVVVNLWDTAGQERFRSLVPQYIRGADMIVLMFSVTTPESFASLDTWLHEIRDAARVSCPIILVGNKCDLEWAIAKEEAKNWADAQQCRLIFTSAKTRENLEALLELISELRGMQTREKMQSVPVPAPPAEEKCC